MPQGNEAVEKINWAKEFFLRVEVFHGIFVVSLPCTSGSLGGRLCFPFQSLYLWNLRLS